MTLARKLFAFAFIAFCPVMSISAAEAQQHSAPDFQEVFDLIRAHLPGESEADLNRTAVDALISTLAPKVSLVGASTQTPEVAAGPLIKKTSLFDAIAYIRIGSVADGLAKDVRDACDRLSTNKLSGVVLDLRYADGEDYAAAADTADLFMAKERPLLNWGKGMVSSKEKTGAITFPVAVLVNGETARAAEALAAVLREAGSGLVLGGKTSGQAMIAQEYPLKNGDRLRIATASIQVGETSLLSAQGLKPDITVEVSPQAEKAYYADAFKERSGTNSPGGEGLSSPNQLNGTNRPRRLRFNEAELVRERREGFSPDADGSKPRRESDEQPVVTDPALARALDLLKGLALVRQSRS
jgi:peptidase S41-like protein